MSVDELLEGRNLVLRYDSTPALRGADISIVANEAVAILGPSGSGKSSLLHCLSCVIRPTEGEVWFEGSRIDDAADEELSQLRRSAFGFVFQFGELLPELDLAENVALPLRLAGGGRAPSEAAAREVLDRLGIGDLASRRPSQVSGGQLQRAAVARGLVHRPRVLFADEPTGALDSQTSEETLDILFDVEVRDGTALVIVTHDETAAQRADRIIRMQDGHITSHGSEPRADSSAIEA